MESIILSVHVVLAIAIVVSVLVQQGKGSNMGASFGGGGSNTVFGSQGSTSFFAKLTNGAILCFFVTSLLLAWGAQQTYQGQPSDVNKLLETIQENAASGESLPGEAVPQVVDTPVDNPQDAASQTPAESEPVKLPE